MKAKDLRLGNLVNAIADWGNEVVEIIELGDEISHNACGTDGSTNCRVDPIILTEEWLVKFGGVKIGSNFFLKGIDIWLNLKTKGYQFRLRGDDNSIDLLHVHQLQNLYFNLTNKELDIK